MEELENIFKNAETQKEIRPSSISWDRLESMLDQESTKSTKFDFVRKIAASFAIVFCMSVAWYFTSNSTGTYKTENLEWSADNDAFLNHIHELNGLYATKFTANRQSSNQLN